jgi:MFS family permease
MLWWFGREHGPHGGAAGGADSAWLFRLVFALSAGFGLLSLALTFFVHDPAEAPGVGQRQTTARAGRLGLPGSYWQTLAILLIFALANSTDAFLLLRARELGYSPATVVLAYALFNVTYTLGSYPAGVLSDRVGRWGVIGLGWIIYAGVYAGFAVTGPRGVWGLMALYGVYMAVTDGVGKALIADHAPKSGRGAALGIFHMLSGLTTLLASIVGGVLWDRVGPAATFWFGAAMALMALVAAGLLRPRIAPPHLE